MFARNQLNSITASQTTVLSFFVVEKAGKHLFCQSKVESKWLAGNPETSHSGTDPTAIPMANSTVSLKCHTVQPCTLKTLLSSTSHRMASMESPQLAPASSQPQSLTSPLLELFLSLAPMA